MSNFPAVCEGCKKEKCPYEGNEYAFEKIARLNSCAFNPPVVEVTMQKKSMGWKKGRQQK